MTYYHVCCISAYVCLHAAGVCLKTSCKLTDLLRAGQWLQTRAAFQYLPNDVTHLFVEYHWASQSSPSFFFFPPLFLEPEVTIFGQEGGAREDVLIGSDREPCFTL